MNPTTAGAAGGLGAVDSVGLNEEDGAAAPALSVSQLTHFVADWGFSTSHAAQIHLLLMSGAFMPAAAQLNPATAGTAGGFGTSTGFGANDPNDVVDDESPAAAAAPPGRSDSHATHLLSSFLFGTAHVTQTHLSFVSGAFMPAAAQLNPPAAGVGATGAGVGVGVAPNSDFEYEPDPEEDPDDPGKSNLKPLEGAAPAFIPSAPSNAKEGNAAAGNTLTSSRART